MHDYIVKLERLREEMNNTIAHWALLERDNHITKERCDELTLYVANAKLKVIQAIDNLSKADDLIHESH